MFVLYVGRFTGIMPSSTDSYEVLGPIGSGTFATCRKVRRKKDGRVCVKFCFLTEVRGIANFPHL